MTFSISSSFIKKKLFIYIFLILITGIVYQNLHNFDFVSYDDNIYVWENPHIRKGLSFENIAWAFGFSETAIKTYWHPVTWISHMADCQFFGLDPGRHHMVNGFLHLLNVLLLFTVCLRMTGFVWQSAFVAAVFAVHPINVESVAWISERKNLLSSLFWLLSILTYLYYVRRPGIKRYLLLLLPFTLGLLAKPMLVTLPCVFLLLDFWPLRRLTILFPTTHDTAQRAPSLPSTHVYPIILEKLPLLVLSFLSVGISLYSVHLSRQIISAVRISLPLRLENAVVSYVKYIGKLVWPRDMAVFYPFPDSIPAWQVVSAAMILLLITAAAGKLLKKAPYVIVGWFWFLGTLFPVIGISQHGRWPEMADRWMYVPEIGLLIIIAWGGSALLSKIHRSRILITVICAFIITALVLIARHQTSYWQDSMTLFAHNLKITPVNAVAHNNVGAELTKQKRWNEAIYHFLRAIKINPAFTDAYYNMGNALDKLGNTKEAIPYYAMALRIDPDLVIAHNSLGNAWNKIGRTDLAIDQYLHALNIDPNFEEAYNNLGNTFNRLGQTDMAVRYYRRSLAINPNNAKIHYNLSVMLYREENLAEASDHLQKAIMLKPDYTPATELLSRIQHMPNVTEIFRPPQP